MGVNYELRKFIPTPGQSASDGQPVERGRPVGGDENRADGRWVRRGAAEFFSIVWTGTVLTVREQRSARDAESSQRSAALRIGNAGSMPVVGMPSTGVQQADLGECDAANAIATTGR